MAKQKVTPIIRHLRNSLYTLEIDNDFPKEKKERYLELHRAINEMFSSAICYITDNEDKSHILSMLKVAKTDLLQIIEVWSKVVKENYTDYHLVSPKIAVEKIENLIKEFS